jgi:hypothetical protein
MENKRARKMTKISTRLYYDAGDAYGRVINPDELGLGGAVVTLLDYYTGKEVASTTTNPDGTWEMKGVPRGRYKQRIDAPAGYVDTEAYAGEQGVGVKSGMRTVSVAEDVEGDVKKQEEVLQEDRRNCIVATTLLGFSKVMLGLGGIIGGTLLGVAIAALPIPSARFAAVVAATTIIVPSGETMRDGFETMVEAGERCGV